MNCSAVKSFVNKVYCRGGMKETENTTCQYGNWKLRSGLEGNSKEKDLNRNSCSENKTAEGLEDGLAHGHGRAVK